MSVARLYMEVELALDLPRCWVFRDKHQHYGKTPMRSSHRNSALCIYRLWPTVAHIIALMTTGSFFKFKYYIIDISGV